MTKPDYLTRDDYPLLFSAGFKPGVADSIMWYDNWQAHIDGEKMYFIEHYGDMRRKGQRQMTREEFGSLFPL